MKNINRWLILGLLPLALSGCIESMVQVDVNKDGSARVTYQEFFSPQITQMMESFVSSITNSMSKMVGATNAVAATGGMEMFKENVEKRLEDLGSSATLVSSTTTTSAAGWKGYIAVYSVKDINTATVRLGDAPNKSGAKASSTSGATFKFTPGPVANLQIIPLKKPDTAKPAASTTAPGDDPAMGAAMMQAMAPMMKGLHFGFVVRVNGEITQTDATHVRRPNTITVIDVEMDKLLANSEAVKYLGPNNPENTKKLIALKIPGVMLEEEGKSINVQFK